MFGFHFPISKFQFGFQFSQKCEHCLFPGYWDHGDWIPRQRLPLHPVGLPGHRLLGGKHRHVLGLDHSVGHGVKSETIKTEYLTFSSFSKWNKGSENTRKGVLFIAFPILRMKHFRVFRTGAILFALYEVNGPRRDSFRDFFLSKEKRARNKSVSRFISTLKTLK